MEEGKAHQILQESWFRHLKNKDDQWLKVDDHEDDSSHENSMVSDGSSVYFSSCDTADEDASSSSNSSGSLYDLSELMVQLPIKRGLSKFYQGRSESFTSLSRVTSVEDLAKKTTTQIRRKRKSCDYKPYILPKPIISKTKKSRPSHKKMEELCSLTDFVHV